LPLSLDIDHAVIAVRDLDAAAASFTALGFTLTPRGYHSIGSQNHCIMLGSTYIELLAASASHPWLDYYRDFGDGLAALALSTEDADAAYRALTDRGVAAKTPLDLARPVEGGVARFRLVRIENAPQLFICQHLTRELVWRREWQSHANGAAELIGVALRAPKPFEGLPASIEWSVTSALRVRGLRRDLQPHGVGLIAA
jgi:catechol 2,3-dioxygenase-like lactoylglutathione lyase family enzyme